MSTYTLYCGINSIVIGDRPVDSGYEYQTIEYYDAFVGDLLDGRISGNFHIAGDAEKLLCLFKESNKYIEAAGGYVLDPSGRSLVILRNGLYDLPKGKLEQGESTEVAAVREVEEETGISGPVIRRKLLDTYHFYRYGNDPQIVFKKTYWYLMSHSGGDTNPQTEEGITDCMWVDDSDISRMCSKTHRNLKILFQLKLDSEI